MNVSKLVDCYESWTLSTVLFASASLSKVNSTNLVHDCIEVHHFLSVPQGEIVSCSGTNLYLWTMKGQLLASVNTPYGPEGSILCCCFTQKYEWDPRNIIITGCTDGIVRVSALQFKPLYCGYTLLCLRHYRCLDRIIILNEQ